MSTIIASSLLESRPAAFRPIFAPLPIHDTLFFDEGPRQRNVKSKIKSTMSGAMDTSAVDPYTQGVEITQQKQYDAGIAKIWSGEPGHQLRVNQFGMDKNFFVKPGFSDLDLFDPLIYIKQQENLSAIYSSIFTFPLVTGDNDQLENFNFNSIIEPLSIRPVVSFSSIESPFESHAVRASLLDGNTNHVGGSDRILTVDYFTPEKEIVGYLDMVDMIHNMPLNGYFQHEMTSFRPFSDERLLGNMRNVASQPADLRNHLSFMTGSTENYVHHNQRSATCGWYYDNNTGVGTDSLVFGGMTY